MWHSFFIALQKQLSNPLVTGALELGLVGIVAASLRNLPITLWGQIKRAGVVTATLDNRNDLFGAFVLWLNDQPFSRSSRMFTVVQAAPSISDDSVDADSPQLRYSPAPGVHFFWYRRHLMWMKRELAMNLQLVETIRLSALFGSRRLMEDVLEGVSRHAGALRANRLTLYVVDRAGDDWRIAETKPRRSLSSVVLDEGVARRLQDDIGEFFSRRDWYATMGIPWRRGYLLSGPPGTGKTSTAFAVAGELHLKLCALSLTNPKLTDSVIADLLQRTPPRSLILIEDIDAFFRERNKQDERIQISFSGLLNALDGVGAQEGRIVVLTTNYRERLDPALIRPGRIDVEIELGNATQAQLYGLLQRFYPNEVPRIRSLVPSYPGKTLSPAQIQQILIASSSFQDAETALRTAYALNPPP